jgi:large subunit ribosomal protein L5
VTTTEASAPVVPRLKQRYHDEIRGQLKESLGLGNIMEVPRLEKIVLNMGVGGAVQQASLLEAAVRDLEIITGQKPIVTKATKSIAGFKVREGMPVGARVTLRGARMWEFLDRLIAIALPRIRDFRGLNPRSMDGRGNFSLGIREQIIFPEIDYDEIGAIRGLDVAITTTAPDDEQGLALLRALGMPFTRPEIDEGESQ